MSASHPRHRGLRSVPARARITAAVLGTALLAGYAPSLGAVVERRPPRPRP